MNASHIMTSIYKISIKHVHRFIKSISIICIVFGLNGCEYDPNDFGIAEE